MSTIKTMNVHGFKKYRKKIIIGLVSMEGNFIIQMTGMGIEEKNLHNKFVQIILFMGFFPPVTLFFYT